MKTPNASRASQRAARRAAGLCVHCGVNPGTPVSCDACRAMRAGGQAEPLPPLASPVWTERAYIVARFLDTPKTTVELFSCLKREGVRTDFAVNLLAAGDLVRWAQRDGKWELVAPGDTDAPTTRELLLFERKRLALAGLAMRTPARESNE